jgi:hypothetical protein
MLSRADIERRKKMNPYMEGLRIAIMREKPKSLKYKLHKEFFKEVKWSTHFDDDAFPLVHRKVINKKTKKVYKKQYSVYQLASMYLFSIGYKPDMPSFDTAFKRTYQTLIKIHALRSIPGVDGVTSAYRETFKLYRPDGQVKNVTTIPGTQFLIHKKSRCKLPFNMFAQAYAYFYTQTKFLNELPNMKNIRDFRAAFTKLTMHNNKNIFLKHRTCKINTEKLKIFKAMRKTRYFENFKEAYRLGHWIKVTEYLRKANLGDIRLPLNRVTVRETIHCVLPSFLMYCFRYGLDICQKQGASIDAKRVTMFAKSVVKKDNLTIEQKKEKARKHDAEMLKRKSQAKENTAAIIRKIKKAKAKSKSKSKASSSENNVAASSSENNVAALSSENNVAASSSENNVAASSSENNAPVENKVQPILSLVSSSENNALPIASSSESNVSESKEPPAMSFPSISSSESNEKKKKPRKPKEKPQPRESLPRAAKNKKH